MQNRESLQFLGQLIERARKLAHEIDEPMASYILGIASLEISEKIEHADEIRSPDMALH